MFYCQPYLKVNFTSTVHFSFISQSITSGRYTVLHVFFVTCCLVIVFEKHCIRKFPTINNILELLQFSVPCLCFVTSFLVTFSTNKNVRGVCINTYKKIPSFTVWALWILTGQADSWEDLEDLAFIMIIRNKWNNLSKVRNKNLNMEYLRIHIVNIFGNDTLVIKCKLLCIPLGLVSILRLTVFLCNAGYELYLIYVDFKY